MRAWAYIIALIAVAAAAAGFVLQSRWEAEIIERSLVMQARMTDAGIRQDWERVLGAAVDAGTLPFGYALEFDRSGKQLLTPFFPSVPVKRDWTAFRAARDSGRLAEAKAFVRSALGDTGGWDRILALSAYRELEGGSWPEGPEGGYRGYEETVVSPEAHRAYALILDAFAGGNDLSLVGKASTLHGCFLKVTDEGRLVGYVPRRADVEATLLAGFERGVGRQGMRLTGTALDLATGEPQRQGAVRAGPKLLFLTAGLALAVALASLLLAVRHERRGLLRHVGFLDQVVHELRTPLAALKLHAQLMQRHGPNPKSVAAVEDNANRMTRLFNDIVAINEHGGAVDRVTLTSAALTALLGETVATFDSAARLIGMPPACDVVADPVRLRQIVHNLLDNGRKYGDMVTVSVEAYGRAAVAVAVTDDGPGILRRDARRIFKPFFRGDAAQKRAPDGLGLGLHLARRMARAMGAELLLANPGKAGGAKFLLVLPGLPATKAKDDHA